MIESVIMLLIYVCLVVAVAWLILWVVQQIGIPLPPQVIKIFWVIIGLIVLLLLWRMVGPAISHGRLP
jgi:hypothetical protein